MAKVKSDLMKVQTGESEVRVFPSSYSGRVRIAHGVIVPSEKMPAGTVLELVRLPKGARVLPVSQIHFEAGQNKSLTIKVGDAAKTDRYLASVAPGIDNASIALGGNKFADYTLPGEATVFATTGGADLAADKKVVFDILYVVD